MNNITPDGYWDFENLKYIDVDNKDLDKYSLQKGDPFSTGPIQKNWLVKRRFTIEMKLLLLLAISFVLGSINKPTLGLYGAPELKVWKSKII